MRPAVGCLVLLVASATFAVAPVAPAGAAPAADTVTCGGVAFVDLDADGDRNEPLVRDGAPDDLEPALADVAVRVVDRLGRTTTTATADDGTWSLPVDVTDFPIRVELTPPTGLLDSVAGPTNATSRQLVIDPSACAEPATGSAGFVDPHGYCDPDASIVVACPARSDADDASPEDAAVRIVPAAARDTRATDATTADGWLSRPTEVLAAVGDIGTVHGLAVARDGRVFAASFVKRHTELASRLVPSGNPTAIFELRAGRRPRLLTVLDPTASDPHRPGGSTVEHDAAVMDDVFRAGIGDLELSADGELLHAVDLGRRALVTIDPDDGEIVSSTPLDGIRLGIDSCGVTGASPFGDLRPFGLGTGTSGQLLVGVVCSAESTVGDALPIAEQPEASSPQAGDHAALIGYVFEHVDGRFRERLAWPLSGRRGETAAEPMPAHEAVWHPWVDEYPFADEHDVVSYPQPAITDLVVDRDGRLVIAIGDRWSHQTAPGSTVPSASGGVDIVESIAAGDLQRACPDGDRWVIEGDGDCEGGIGDGWEFFRGDRYGYHSETPLGGLAGAAGRHEVIATQMNPVPADDTWHSGGLAWHDTTTGELVDGLRVYDGRSARPHGTFEQAAGTGDVELLCGEIPIVFGGLVWYDADGDGHDDPDEPGIPGVPIVLVDRYERVLAEVATDAAGRYEIDERDLEHPLLRGADYRLVVPDEARRTGPFGPSGQWTGLRPAEQHTAGRIEIDVVADDHTPVQQRLDLAMVDQYDLALHAELVRDDELDVLGLDLVVSNQGSVPSGGFTVTSRVPEGTELVGVGSVDPTVIPEVDGDRVTWRVPRAHEIAPGASLRLSVRVRVAERGTTEHVYAAQIVGAEGTDDDSTPGDALLDHPGSLPRFDSAVAPADQVGPTATEDDAGALVVRLSTVAGSIWFDDDRDGVRDLDPPESFAAGVEVRLLREDGTEYARAFSDADGWFEFPLVESGTYRVELPAENFAGPLRGRDVVVRPDGSLAGATTDGYVSGPIVLTTDASEPLAVTHLGIANRPARPMFAGAGPLVIGPLLVLTTWLALNRQRRRHRYGT